MFFSRPAPLAPILLPPSGRYLEYDNVCLRTHRTLPVSPAPSTSAQPIADLGESWRPAGGLVQLLQVLVETPEVAPPAPGSVTPIDPVHRASSHRHLHHLPSRSRTGVARPHPAASSSQRGQHRPRRELASLTARRRACRSLSFGLGDLTHSVTSPSSRPRLATRRSPRRGATCTPGRPTARPAT